MNKITINNQLNQDVFYVDGTEDELIKFMVKNMKTVGFVSLTVREHRLGGKEMEVMFNPNHCSVIKIEQIEDKERNQ